LKTKKPREVELVKYSLRYFTETKNFKILVYDVEGRKAKPKTTNLTTEQEIEPTEEEWVKSENFYKRINLLRVVNKDTTEETELDSVTYLEFSNLNSFGEKAMEIKTAVVALQNTINEEKATEQETSRVLQIKKLEAQLKLEEENFTSRLDSMKTGITEMNKRANVSNNWNKIKKQMEERHNAQVKHIKERLELYRS
jgi:hypothetical protein